MQKELKKKPGWMGALFAYAKNAKGELALSVVFSIVSILLGLVPFWCMYKVICLFAAGTVTKAAVFRWCGWSLAAYAGKVVWISAKSEFTPKTILTDDERADLVYAVKVAVKNSDGGIKIGMYGEVKF